MKKPATLFLVLLMTIVFGITGIAAESSGDIPQTAPGEMQPEGEVMTLPQASYVLGLEVKSNDGQQLSAVKDLIISSGGIIEHLVVSGGGLLGIAGYKLVAIPWKDAEVRFYENTLLVGLSKEKFDKAPAFASWDEFAKYEQQVRAYYGKESGSQGLQPGR